MSIPCSVCLVEESKYKCSKCKIIRYCSINCFSKHKEVCQIKNQIRQPESLPTSTSTSTSTINNIQLNDTNPGTTSSQPITTATAATIIDMKDTTDNNTNVTPLDQDIQKYISSTKTSDPSYVIKNNELPVVLSQNKKLLDRMAPKIIAETKFQASNEELHKLDKNEKLVFALQNGELRSLIQGIINETNIEKRRTILSYQLEFNHDFSIFVQEMLSTLDGTQEVEQDKEKQLENILYQLME